MNREERQLAVLWAVLAAAAVALRPLWLAVAPGLPGCAFRAITGIPCPTCGTTHAAVALLQGHLLAALAANPLAALAGIGFVAGGLAAPVWAAAGWKVPVLPSPLPLRVRLAAVLVALAGWAYVIAASLR